MKWIILSLIVTASILFGLYKGAQRIATDYFIEGTIRESEFYTTCRPEDNSASFFPEYFKACQNLCNELYQEKAKCVPSINGGSITCVCEQHGESDE